MQGDQGTPIAVKTRRRTFSTAHARRHARAYSTSIKGELLEEAVADELRSSHESSLGNGSSAFLRGLLSETDGLIRGISDRYQTQKEVSKKV